MKESELTNLFASYNGVMKTSELKEHGFYYKDIQELLASGQIRLLRRGYYQIADNNDGSEISAIATLFPDGILCLESALIFYGYTKSQSIPWQIAVDDRSQRRRFKSSGISVRPHFVEPGKFHIGATTGDFHGTHIKVYDRERTICDCLLHQNKMDREIFKAAIKCYLNDPQKNISRLVEYASTLHVDKKMQNIIGIWL